MRLDTGFLVWWLDSLTTNFTWHAAASLARWLGNWTLGPWWPYSRQYFLCRAKFIAWRLRYPNQGIPKGLSSFCTCLVWASTLKWPCVKSYLVGGMDKYRLGSRLLVLRWIGEIRAPFTCNSTLLPDTSPQP